MSNLGQKPPLGLKTPKATKKPKYLAEVAKGPCCVCEAFGEIQTSPTTVHHVTHDRFSQRKTPDEMAIGLCVDHHQGGLGSPKIALHESPEAWRAKYGADYDFTPATQDRILK